MKRFFKFLLILPAAIGLIYSCSAPRSIIKLEPETESAKWFYGQPLVVDSLYGIVYEVGFDRMQGNEYWFDFHIANHSNMPILIDPADFSCQAFDSLMNRHSQTVIPLKAIDPEKKIMGIDKELSRNEARERNHLGISMVAAGVDIVSGAIVLSDDNPGNDGLRTHLLEDVQIDRADNQFEIQDLNALRDSWANTTIRKTTLESSYFMHGKVFFTAIPSAAYIKLFLPVDDEKIEMTFKQIQHQVK